MATYKGDILLDMLVSAENLSKYKLNKKRITSWSPRPDDTYEAEIGNNDIYIISVRSGDSDTGIGHYAERKSGKTYLISYDKQPVDVYYLDPLDSSTATNDKFYPNVNADQVYFPDGKTLIDKLKNGTLLEQLSKYVSCDVLENSFNSYRFKIKVGRDEIISPNLLKNNDDVFIKRYMKTEWRRVVGQHSTFYLEIPNETHKLKSPYVEQVLIVDTNGVMTPAYYSFSINTNDTVTIYIYDEPADRTAVYLKDIRHQRF